MITEGHFGPHHPDAAVILNNYGVLLKKMGRTEEAERMLRRALEIDEREFGPDHPDTGRDIGNLGMLLEADDKLEEAEPLLRRTLKIDEEAYGPNHPDVAVDLFNLASLLLHADRLEEAEGLCRRAIDIMAASRGENYPATRQIKRALEELKAIQAAPAQKKKAVAIDSQFRLAKALQMRGELGDAMTSFRRLERMHREVGDLVGIQNSIGFQSEILCAMGDFEGAINLDRKRERFCREHDYTEGLIISLANQAHLLAGQLDRPKEALPLAEESFQLAMKCGLNELAQQVNAILRYVHSCNLSHAVITHERDEKK
jgi:tetratricopeptide (TPR) repeat protein